MIRGQSAEGRGQKQELPPGIRSFSSERVVAEGKRKFELIAIGCSMGGMHALQVIFGVLPKDFPVPIAVVQHRYRTSNEGLPEFLRRRTELQVVDTTDKEWLRPGTVYLAPANYHLLVERGELSLSVDEAVAYSRPSIDVLFESAADAYGAGVIGVILTGANADGAKGTMRIKSRGGFVIAQDPETAESPAMPRAAIEAARVDRILPLDRIGPFLVELCRATRDMNDRVNILLVDDQPNTSSRWSRSSARWGESGHGTVGTEALRHCCTWTSRSCCWTCRCGHRRLRDRQPDPPARPLARHADHLSHRPVAQRVECVPRYDSARSTTSSSPSTRTSSAPR